MVFAGFDEETPPRLIYDDKRKVLQRGGVDSFIMAVPRPLGPINHVRQDSNISTCLSNAFYHPPSL